MADIYENERYTRLKESLFSDESAMFRSPSEPDEGDRVTVRIRALKGCTDGALMMFFEPRLAVGMARTEADGMFDVFSAELICTDSPVSYVFILDCGGKSVIYDKTGAHDVKGDAVKEACATAAFRFTPGFHVPEWAKGAVEYQIFTDRFCNGNALNDVADNEYYYLSGHSRHVAKWSEYPAGDADVRSFYGGDLQGVMQKLDYLQKLGVEAVYFNPLFISPSNHKYDTQDYDHIDPHFAIVTDDVVCGMEEWERHNGFAQRYIHRVTSRENLEKSDAFFARLCGEMHSRGMKVILDGVFNHCGSYNKWMDKEGIYLGKPGYEPGACQDTGSPYRKYFRFNARGGSSPEYEGWWGYPTLPKLNYEGSEELQEKIFKIAEKWASPPYSIDGWRLDVAADLGHSEEFNHAFWKEFRARLKAVNPELLIIAEHYGDPSPWLRGDEWDTVMNYDAFMEPVTFFLTGMEKHSDSRRNDLYGNGEAFFTSMLKNMARFEYPSLMSAMNELSNHDHSRFMTRTNRTVGRTETLGPEAAGENTVPGVFRQAVVIQMTWPGAPTIYYADEAGQVGWTDPDNRRTYPWGKEDRELIALHSELTALRRTLPVLKTGSLKPLAAGQGLIAYARFDARTCAVVVCTGPDGDSDIELPAVNLGLPDGTLFSTVFLTDMNGHSGGRTPAGAVHNGVLRISLPACASAILVAEERSWEK